MDHLITKVRDDLISLGLVDFEYELVMTDGTNGMVRIFTTGNVPPLLKSMASKLLTQQDANHSSNHRITKVIEVDLSHLSLSDTDEQLPLPPHLLLDTTEQTRVTEVTKIADPVRTVETKPGPPGPPGVRGTNVFSGFVPYQGKVVNDLPEPGTGNYLVPGQGIYTTVDNKWKLATLTDLTMFYDEDKRDFLMVKGLNVSPAFAGVNLIEGDILIDGAKGRIYLYNGGKWVYDKRVSLIGPKGDAGQSGLSYTTIKVDKDGSIPDGIRTVFVDAGRGAVTLTLPKARCDSHQTPIGVICDSPMLTIVNISQGNHDKVKIKAKSPDKIYNETPSVITRGNSMTYQSYGGVWYLVCQG